MPRQYAFRPRLMWIALACFVTSCGTRPAEQARQYELQGQILAIRADAGEVLIKHGDITGFMPGMNMPFKVRDQALLDGKAAGDLVSARLVVTRDEAWLSQLDKTGTAPLTEMAAIPPAAFVAPLTPGDEAPDTALTDQNDRRVTLADWRGAVVAVTFTYTSCPLPQFCPMLDRRFAEAARAIKADAQLSGRARLLSVSFDPDNDTAARLRAHAATLAADGELWRFATAPRERVDRFAAQFGVNVVREQDRTITHNMRTAVIGPDGRVASIHEGSGWTSTLLVDDMRRALGR